MIHSLALANVFHRKIRAALSISAVCMGVCMLIVMLGLSHGTLGEVADRVTSVGVELIVVPEGRNLIFTTGAPLSPKYKPMLEAIQVDGVPAVERAVAAYFHQIKLGGQEQRVFGVDRDDFKYFLGDRRWVDGHVYDQSGRFKNSVESKRNEQGAYNPDAVADEEIQLGCEMVIDSRLARVGRYKVGDKVEYMGRTFTIVGIFESGPAGRVFVPIQILQHFLNSGMPWSSAFFVKVTDAVRQRGEGAVRAVAKAIEDKTGKGVIEKASYEKMLYESFSQVYVFINVFSVVVLIFAVFFVLLTTYTMVLERTREIGILKSLGAGRWFLIRQAMAEALILSGVGTGLGIALSFGAKYAIERFRPLMTVEVAPEFILLGLAVGVLAGVIGSLYPAARVTRLDPATALSFE
ncbi:MAG: ABC transporter permease [Phycisphaerae bacterium]|nr:ABC transporter permease [Phycisphaerae bacterium]